MDIERYTEELNALRIKGGVFNSLELAKALRGIMPYSSTVPTIMRRNPDISGYTVLEKGIEFDPKHSIYKDAVAKIIEEAARYAAASNKRVIATAKRKKFILLLHSYVGEFNATPLIVDRVVKDICISLYSLGKCVEVPAILKAYKKYLKIC